MSDQEYLNLPEAPDPKILAVPDSFFPDPIGGDMMYESM
jgi:hypothetical protein